MFDSALADIVHPFQLEGQPVRGRIVRLQRSIDEILSRHAYPAAVAQLLGECCALAALVGSNLKFDGRLIVQAQGDGPVAYVVADYDPAGGLRGYCRFDAERVAAVSSGFVQAGARTLLGDKAIFVMTLDPGGGLQRYQGVTPIEGESLSLCAEQYFQQSEQTPTRVLLAVGRDENGWRAGGFLIQALAPDALRGDTDDGWRTAEAFFETLGEDELLDPEVSSAALLHRLFHEGGVRLFDGRPLHAFCRCSAERTLGLLRSFPAEERVDMVEDDGQIRVTCEYCSTVYTVDPADI